MLFAASAGTSRHLLEARLERAGAIRWRSIPTADGARFGGFAVKLGADGWRVKLDRVPRAGRLRPAVYALWVDRAPLAQLEAFDPAPSIIVAHSGGHDAVWSLSKPLEPDKAIQTLELLAHRLGGDPDAARLDARGWVPGSADAGGEPVRCVRLELTSVKPRRLLNAARSPAAA
jgi:hypothetical protein